MVMKLPTVRLKTSIWQDVEKKNELIKVLLLGSILLSVWNSTVIYVALGLNGLIILNMMVCLILGLIFFSLRKYSHEEVLKLHDRQQREQIKASTE